MKNQDCVFSGYLEHTKGYRLYDEETKKFSGASMFFMRKKTANKKMISKVSNEGSEIIHTVCSMIKPENHEEQEEELNNVSEESLEIPNKNDLREINNEIDQVSNDTNSISDNNQNSQVQEEPSSPRRSNCISKLKRWLDYVTFKVSMEPTGEEPTNVQEALISPHNKK